MTALFITILNMSISAGVVALAVILVRIPMKKAPKIFSYVLWAVVLFRSICPFSFNNSFSLMPISAEVVPQNIIYSHNPAIQSGISMVDNSVNTAINNALPPANPVSGIHPIHTTLGMAVFIWLLGFAALLLYAATGYTRLKRRVCYATLIRENIYETDKINTPFVLGFIRPQIYLPMSLKNEQLDYILKHEQVHIRRRDYLIKPFAFLSLAIHWFNPIIWVSYYLMSKDMEMSCDEAVLQKADGDIRGSYSSSLLNLSAKKVNLISPLAFGESNTKSRVKNALKFKKPAIWVIFVSILIVFALFIGFASNRVAVIPNLINTNEIILQNGNTGESKTITDTNTVNAITKYFQSAKFSHKERSGNSTGWSYRLQIYDMNNYLTADIVVMSSNRIKFMNYFYEANSDDTIDMAYIEALFLTE